MGISIRHEKLTIPALITEYLNYYFSSAVCAYFRLCVSVSVFLQKNYYFNILTTVILDANSVNRHLEF